MPSLVNKGFDEKTLGELKNYASKILIKAQQFILSYTILLSISKKHLRVKQCQKTYTINLIL